VRRVEAGTPPKLYLIDISKEELAADLVSSQDLRATAAYNLIDLLLNLCTNWQDDGINESKNPQVEEGSDTCLEVRTYSEDALTAKNPSPQTYGDPYTARNESQEQRHEINQSPLVHLFQSCLIRSVRAPSRIVSSHQRIQLGVEPPSPDLR
jgi:hypothetical protein